MASFSFSFPGIDDVTQVDIQYSHGIAPGVCRVIVPIELLDLDNLGLGTLILSDETQRTTLVWEEAIPDVASIEYSERGHIASIPILDRRWRWKYGAIYGTYNVRKADPEDGENYDTIKPHTLKTPEELADLLLIAMGETIYDLTELPDLARPEISWDGDRPALELDALCQDLGCRIIFNYTSNQVVIKKTGEGELLPINDDLITPSVSYADYVFPSKVTIWTGPTMFESRLQLEAVGMDTDDEIKLLGDLSYKPQEWTPDHYNLLDGPANDENMKRVAYAQRSVFRYYRVADNFYNRSIMQSYTGEVIDYIDQLEILPHLAEKDSDDTYKLPKVVGLFTREEEYGQPEGNQVNEWEGSITVDEKKRLVIFADTCYMSRNPNSNISAADPAQMYLQCAFYIRTNEERRYYRYDKSEFLSDDILDLWRNGQDDSLVDTGGDEYVHDEITHIVRRDGWSERTFTNNGAQTLIINYGSTFNSRDLTTRKECDHYLQSIIDQYSLQEESVGGQGVYRGLHIFELDGLRDYVLISCGVDSPLRTSISMVTTPNPYILSWKDKRRKWHEARSADFVKRSRRLKATRDQS